jgi:hypothetical protein
MEHLEKIGYRNSVHQFNGENSFRNQELFNEFRKEYEVLMTDLNQSYFVKVDKDSLEIFPMEGSEISTVVEKIDGEGKFKATLEQSAKEFIKLNFKGKEVLIFYDFKK